MTRLTQKFWFLTAAVCLLATLGAYVSSAANHLFEEVNTELVEVEETKAIAQRTLTRKSKQKQSYKLCVKSKLSVHRSTVGLTCSSFTSQFERDNLNGIGGYLRL